MSFILNRATSNSPAGGVSTLTGNTGGAVSPTLGNINLVGSGVISVAGNPGTSTLTISAAATVATSYVTDSGTATPALNILKVLGGTNVTTSGSGDTVTINAAADLEYNLITTSTTPYVALSTDQVICVDSSGGARQVNLPNAPTTGRWFTIKDSTGSAATNNITITTVGGVVTIDGSTTFAMNTAYQSATAIFDGSKYLII